MESTATPAGDLAFYSSKKSGQQQTRIGLWAGLLLVVPLQIYQAGGIGAALTSTFFWFTIGFVLLICFVMDRILARQLDTTRAFATLTEHALLSPNLAGKNKILPWADIKEVSLERMQGSPYLQFALKESSSLYGQRSFWSSLSGDKLTLSLSTLSDDEQPRFIDAINLRIGQAQGHTATALPLNPLAEEIAFKQELERLTPHTWFTYGLIALNVVIWLLTLAGGASIISAPADKLLTWGGNATSAVQQGEWWRLLSATFLHSGLMHITMNMLGLYSAGILLERIYGPRLFVLIYLGSGLVGSALSLSYSAQSAVSVGASGAVFGITGALLVAMLQHRDKLPASVGKNTISGLAFFIFYSLLQGFSHAGIDNAAHIGGLISGAVLALILPERLDMQTYLRTLTQRSLIASCAVLLAVIGLNISAAPAAIDQKRVLASAPVMTEGFKEFDAAIKALQQEWADGKLGKFTERELDDRSRAVFAPRFKRVTSLLSQVELRPDDPRAGLLKDCLAVSTLLTESLAMESVYTTGSDKPQPVDPVRAEQLNEELKTAFNRLQNRLADIQNKKAASKSH